MSRIDEVLQQNDAYAARLSAPLPTGVARQLAVVACMDARLNVYDLLGLRVGEAHVIRNAGGTVTDDVVRSLSVSQRLLGTRSVALVHHTDCGMLTFTDEEFQTRLEQETGTRPEWSAGAFTDLAEDVRAGMTRLRESPFLPHTDDIRGFIFDVVTGYLAEVH